MPQRKGKRFVTSDIDSHSITGDVVALGLGSTDVKSSLNLWHINRPN